MHVTLRRHVDQPNNINASTNADNTIGISNRVGGVTLSPNTLLRRHHRGCYPTLLECYHRNICDNDTCGAYLIKCEPCDQMICLLPYNHAIREHYVDPWLANNLLTMAMLAPLVQFIRC